MGRPGLVLLLSVGLLFCSACASGRAGPGSGRDADSVRHQRQRAALGRCLDALAQVEPSRAFAVLAHCLVEQHLLAPACEQAWAAAGAAAPAARRRLIATACAEAHCPRLSAPKPSLCAETAAKAAGISARDWTELHLRILGARLALERYPALQADLAAVLSTVGAAAPGKTAGAADKISDAEQQAVVKIGIGQQGLFTLGGRQLDADGLAEALQTLRRRRPQATVVIASPPGADYRTMVRLLDLVRRAGYHDIVMQPAR
jgi:biopolymer transport protein ExbD